MITKLTKKQEQNIKKYFEEGMRIGLDTHTNKGEAEKAITDLYAWCGYDKPIIWWCQSPCQMQFVIHLIKNCKLLKDITTNIWDNIEDNIRANIEDNIRDNIWDDIRANIEDNIRDNIGDNIEANIWANIRVNIWANIEANIKDNIEANIRSNIRANIDNNIWANIMANIRANIDNNIGANIMANIWDNIGANIMANIEDNIRDMKVRLFYDGYGQHEIYWIMYYKFFVDHFADLNFNIEAKKGLDIMCNIACESGWWYPFKGIVFMCEKNISINYDVEQKRLHNDTVPAVEYSDGYKIYALNNIMIPAWIFETEKEKLDVKKIIAIDNVEVKKEVISWLGEEWFFEKVGKKLVDTKYLYVDKDHKVYTEPVNECKSIEYRLVEADIGLSEKIKLLCMDNASVEGVKHYEIVEPHCKTVLDAFESRTGIRSYPVYLS